MGLQEQPSMRVRYPNVHVRITEDTPEASSILERVCCALKEGGASDEEVETYTREATSLCYNNLMFTTMVWVETSWE